MRVYIAGPWVKRTVAAEVATVLDAANYVITQRWWEHEEVVGYPQPNGSLVYPEPAAQEMARQALKDYQGVVSAEALVVLNLTTSEGKAVEQGIALALGKKILVYDPYGGRLNIFQNLTNGSFETFHSWQGLLARLEKLREEYETALEKDPRR